jgi:hypothetical protein
MSQFHEQSPGNPSGAAFFTDEELTELALAGDHHAPLDPAAVPWDGGVDAHDGLLPEWYMPRPRAVGRGRGTRLVIIAVVVGFVLINAFGLCITSGFITLA